MNTHLTGHRNRRRLRRRGLGLEIGALVALLIVAGFLRFHQLDAVPPGMTHDEAAFGAEAEVVLAGDYPIYFALGYGHEPAYGYLVALAFALAGPSLLALRVTSAVCGLLVVAGTYLVGRTLLGRPAAWIAAAWMAVAFWPLSLSRQALRAVTLPLLWLPAVWCTWQGLRSAGLSAAPGYRRHRWSRALGYGALGGLFLGLSIYTYMASRVAWLILPVFALYLLLQQQTRLTLRRVWPVIAAALLIGALVALPLVIYLRTHPSAEVRIDVMMTPVQELLEGKPEEVLRHAWDALRVYSWVGDRFWAYNISGRPVFGWVGSIVFYGGVAWALWQWRAPQQAFLLIWLAVGLAPAMVTTNEGIYLRAIVAQPATYLLMAGVLDALRGGLTAAGRRRHLHIAPQWANAAWAVLVLILLGLEAQRSYQAYFVEWASHPKTRMIYNHNLVASARYLRDQPTQEAIGISALYPRYYHDPWIFRYVARRPDLPVRWFDGRGGIVYPGAGEGRYVFSALTPLDPAIRTEFEAQARLVERQQLDPADENPSFELWQWEDQGGLEGRLEALQSASPLWVSPETRFDQPALRQELRGDAQFGELIALLGYRVNATAFHLGDTVEVVTYWRALDTVQAEDDWTTFVHLLDMDSRIMGSIDVLHCPPTGWYPGDTIVQVHRFQVDPDPPGGAGPAYLELGLYRHSTGRLPILVDGKPVADRLLLVPVEVR